MDKSFLDLLRRNGFVRSVLAVAAVLVLGALGSGLWELLLKDLFLGLGNVTLSLISLLWGGYVDLLHLFTLPGFYALSRQISGQIGCLRRYECPRKQAGRASNRVPG